MKKIYLILITVFIANTVMAQEEEEFDKKWRFGISGAPSLNWYQPENEKKFTSGGTAFKFGWGLDVEKRLSKIVSFEFGVQFNYDGGILNFGGADTSSYYMDKTEELIEIKDIDFSDTAITHDLFRVNSRTYNMTYVNIPLGIKMRTKEIGYMTYYGELGMNLGFKYKGRSTDNVTPSTVSSALTKEQINIEKDMNLFRAQVHIGGGAEYTISGTTALVFGLAYNLGVNNVIKKESRHIFGTSNTGISQNAVPHNVQLKVGILF